MKIVDEPEIDLDALREEKIARKIEEIDESAKLAKTRCKKPVKLTWEDLKYTVSVKDPRSKSKFRPDKITQQIIKGVSGYALPG